MTTSGLALGKPHQPASYKKPVERVLTPGPKEVTKEKPETPAKGRKGKEKAPEAVPVEEVTTMTDSESVREIYLSFRTSARVALRWWARLCVTLATGTAVCYTGDRHGCVFTLVFTLVFTGNKHGCVFTLATSTAVYSHWYLHWQQARLCIHTGDKHRCVFTLIFALALWLWFHTGEGHGCGCMLVITWLDLLDCHLRPDCSTEANIPNLHCALLATIPATVYITQINLILILILTIYTQLTN